MWHTINNFIAIDEVEPKVKEFMPDVLVGIPVVLSPCRTLKLGDELED